MTEQQKIEYDKNLKEYHKSLAELKTACNDLGTAWNDYSFVDNTLLPSMLIWTIFALIIMLVIKARKESTYKLIVNVESYGFVYKVTLLDKTIVMYPKRNIRQPRPGDYGNLVNIKYQDDNKDV